MKKDMKALNKDKDLKTVSGGAGGAGGAPSTAAGGGLLSNLPGGNKGVVGDIQVDPKVIVQKGSQNINAEGGSTVGNSSSFAFNANQ